MNRRKFVQNAAVVAAGTAALNSTALSYARILGANDRISLGHIGPGARGIELVGMVGALKDKFNVEMTAVCDLWTHNLERAVEANRKLYGKAPRACHHPEELIALKDKFNVEMTAVCDLWTHNLERAVEANRKLYGKAPRACHHPEELIALKDKFNVEMTAVCDLWTHNLERAVEANRKLYGKAPRACHHPEELIALKDKFNVEMTAVCDLWTHNLERAVEANRKLYGKAPRACHHPEELIALKDVDAVIISTPEHSHSPLLKMVADAGRDGYCEKPMGNVLEEAKAARDAVQSRNLIVQIGTQHRSEQI